MSFRCFVQRERTYLKKKIEFYGVTTQANICIHHLTLSWPWMVLYISIKLSPYKIKNSVIERKHHHSVYTTRTLLTNAPTLIKFWGHVILTAFYLINHIPSSVLDNEIPIPSLFSKDLLYVFDFTCFGHHFSLDRDKLSIWALKCVFWDILKLKNGFGVVIHLHLIFCIWSYLTLFEDTLFFVSPLSQFYERCYY